MSLKELADHFGVRPGALHETVGLWVERGVLARVKRLARSGAIERRWTSVYVPGASGLAARDLVRVRTVRATRECPALPELNKAFRLGERPTAKPARESVTTVRARDAVDAETERAREIERLQSTCAFDTGKRMRCSSLLSENHLLLPGAKLAMILE